MALTLFARKKSAGSEAQDIPVRTPRQVPPPEPSPNSVLADYIPASPEKPDDDSIRRMLQQHRFGLLVQNAGQCATHREGGSLIEQAVRGIEDRFAMVPAGTATLPESLTGQFVGKESEVGVEPYLLAIHPVTNREYQWFVDDHSYENMDLWPEEIWPHLIEFHDLTDAAGPRFWREGRHDVRRSDHPVVGVSWHEAVAYCAWAGYRLPSEAEWQMAASWRIRSSADLLRRFPWGDAMDWTRCNLWNAGKGTTVPVTEYATGAAPNGVCQLIGNVWEWAGTEFNVVADNGTPIVGEMPMMGVRGGAFDTYFESQATAAFRTGQIALGRTHNIGFRCALDLVDARPQGGSTKGEGT